MIEFEDVSHIVEIAPGCERAALDSVNLRLEDGEYVALMGANGSGKSTLARHMNALLLPTRGTVRVSRMDTRDASHLWEIRQHVGIVFQNPDHQMVATVVEEEVAFGPENIGLSRQDIRYRVDEALEAVDMQAWRRHHPAHLSGGQKQRVAIASILAMRPSVMVLDEPTAMLDAAGRQEVLDILRRLNRELGLTVVLITHALEEALHAARVIVLQNGRLAADGPLADLAGNVGRLRAFGLMPLPTVRAVHPLALAGMPFPQPMPLDARGLARAIIASSGGGLSAQGLHRDDPGPTRAPTGGLDVSARELCFTYMRGTPFETPALHDINFDLRGGASVALMGPTGCGKTTLMQHLNGLLRATSGEVTVGTHRLSTNASDVRAVRREVGLVFQFAEQQLFEETAALDVSYGPRLLGLSPSEVDRRVHKAFALVGLPYDEFASRAPHALSGGEMRRVALAGVLAMEPRLLVMDEPTAGLDAPGQECLMNAVREIQQDGAGTVIVSHDVELVADLADRLLILEGGHLAADGDVRSLLGADETQARANLCVRPAANQIARALVDEGLCIDRTVVRSDALAQEVICAVMNQTAL